jgi:thiamine-monophosphate kinase
VARTNRGRATGGARSGRTVPAKAVEGGGELEALARIASWLPPAAPGEVWIGDDAAVVAPHMGELLLTVDVVVEGVHADLGLVGLDDFGWRAVSTAVSDIAAMGGCADHLLVSIAAPPSTDLALLYTGIIDASSHHGVSVVGGDLSTAKKIAVTVAVAGHMPEGEKPVLRSGATPGDAIVVTGPLGAAGAGLRILKGRTTARPGSGLGQRLIDAHRRPIARLAEGEVARTCHATAMIDLSDGIASDVRRIASASGVGVSLHEVPIAVGATEDEALCGGDDYELLFCVRDAEGAIRAFEAAGLRAPLVVGSCASDPTAILFNGGPLPECGWEHPWLLPEISTVVPEISIVTARAKAPPTGT